MIVALRCSLRIILLSYLPINIACKGMLDIIKFIILYKNFDIFFQIITGYKSLKFVQNHML